mmetsp:Transcript_4100/g.6240  ORF Transcript_4100/g.6240 Transcript_4100/m.6240 type:complete len:461 (+) Transcript_4100:388-1770(+)
MLMYHKKKILLALVCSLSPTTAFTVPSPLSTFPSKTFRHGIANSISPDVTTLMLQKGLHLYHPLNEDDHENEGSIIDLEVVTPRKSPSKIYGFHPGIVRSWNTFLQSMPKFKPPFPKRIRHKTMTVVTSLLLLLSVLTTPLSDALAAPSGGRMGGSFGGSSRSRSPPTSRSYSRGYTSRPPVRISPGYGYGRTIIAPMPVAPIVQVVPVGSSVGVVSRGPSFVSVVVFTIMAMVVLSSVSNVSNSLLDAKGIGGSPSAMDSALGPGISVAQISVAMNVPRRSDSGSILSYLARLSHTAQTDSRVGIRNLVSQVALELMRQKRSIFAANTEYTHFKDGKVAEREFNSMAIMERSKFEKEGTNVYGGVDYGVDNSDKDVSASFHPQATVAVITLLIAIDGDSTKLPIINNVNDLEKALMIIATDVKVDDCLRSAEVLWTPEGSEDVVTEKDVIVDYPKLRSI